MIILNIFFNKCKNKKVYLCGDFNVDLLKYSCHDATSNFIDQLYSYGLHPLIMRPTRITKESATIIDNIFTNELQRITSSGLIINDLSDHLPIFQICDYTDDVHSNRNQYKTKETRLINDQTLQHFSNALSSASWDDIVNDHDVHHSYRKFINVFSETFNSSFPVRPGSPPQKRKHKPWMTNGLVNACKKKNLLYKRFLTSRCSTSEIRYKTYKNKLTSILRYCEKQYYSDLLKANKNNMKETWKIINDLLKKKIFHKVILSDRVYEKWRNHFWKYEYCGTL